MSRVHALMMDFMIWGYLTRPRGHFRAQGCALTRNVARSHGSKNLLQRGIPYRHENILLRQGRLQAQTQETIWEDFPPGGQPKPALRDLQHGSKNLLQRGILYRHEKILLRQGRLHAQTGENYVGGSGGYTLISLD